jgi:mannitol 2-dehydrogenase
VASWARYAEGTDEHGEPITIVDQRQDRIMAAARQREADPLAFLRDHELFGDLAEQSAFTEPYSHTLESFHTHGARATIAGLAARMANGT